MLSFYQYGENGLVAAQDPAGCQLVRVVAPGADELARLQAMSRVPVEMLSAAMDRDERPRIEIDAPFTLLILRLPRQRDEADDLRYVTSPFGVILTPEYVITVSSEETPVWTEVLSGRFRVADSGDPVPFLSSLVMRIAKYFLTYLRQIRREADEVEKAIEASLRNEMLIRMLNLQKCLVDFATSLRANESVWDRFSRMRAGKVTEEGQELIEDVAIELRQAKELAEIHQNILTGMMDAFASIISNNLGVVVKLLTSVTIILMLPTLVASIYGMNVELPFQHSPHAFMITVALSLVTSIAGVALFWKLKWF